MIQVKEVRVVIISVQRRDNDRYGLDIFSD